MNSFHLRCICTLVLFVLLIPGRLAAQATVTFSGTVLDSTERTPVLGAEVVLDGKAHYSIYSDPSGKFSLEAVIPGRYTLSVNARGYHLFTEAILINGSSYKEIELCSFELHLHEFTFTAHKPDVWKGAATAGREITLSADMLNRNRGQNLGEMLKYTAGLSTLNTGATISKPVIRGLHSQRIVVMNNGVKQEGQQWGLDHAPEIDPFSVDHVELVKGAASVRYGSDAIAGVIRLLPRPMPVTRGIGGELNMNAFSNNGQGAASLLLESRMNSRWAWRVQGSGRIAGDSHAPDYVLSNTGAREYSYNATLDYQHKAWSSNLYYSHDQSTLGIFRGAHLGNTSDLRNAIALGKPYYIQPFTYHIDLPRQQVSHDLVSYKLAYNWKGLGTLRAQLGWQLNHRQEFDRVNPIYTQNVGRPTYDLHLETRSAEVAFEHKMLGAFSGEVGYSYTWQDNSIGGYAFLVPNYRYLNQGIYALEKYHKGRWMAEGGIRYDHRSMASLRYVGSQLVRSEFVYRNMSGVLAVGYHINEKLLVSLSADRAYRAPSINELFINGLHGGTATYEIGDTSLHSERAYHTDLSLKYKVDKLSLTASVYYNYFPNFIYQQPDTQPTLTINGAFPTLRYMETRARITGAELEADVQLGRYWKSGGQLNIVIGDNLGTDRPLVYMPANRARIYLQRNFKLKNAGDTYLRLWVQGVDRQRRYTPGEDYADPPPGYILLDLDASTTFNIRKQQATFSLGVRNMLNTRYRDYLDRFRYFSEEPGINIVVRITIPFTLITFKPDQNQ